MLCAMTATTAKPDKSTPRLGYSPAEFAAAFGRHASWAYRLVYAGKLKVLQSLGRTIIPTTEVDRVLSGAENYDPQPAPKKRKEVASVRQSLHRKIKMEDL